MSLNDFLRAETLEERASRRTLAGFFPVAIDKLKNEFIEYSCDFSLQVNLPFIGEPEQYLNHITGTIRFSGDDSGEAKECGRLFALFVNFEQALNDSVSRLDILDSLDDEFIECAELFNTTRREGTYLTRAAQKVLLSQSSESYTIYDNFVYIKRLEILPKHRGKRLGSYFLDLSLQYLAQTLPIDFFAMKPFPLQSEAGSSYKDRWQQRLALDRLEQDHKKAMRKLRELYAEIGFDPVPRTNLMIRSADSYR